MNTLKYLIIILSLFLSVSSCQKEEKIFLEPNTGVTIFSNTKMISSDNFEQEVVFIDSTDFTLTVKKSFISEHELSVGDIIISDVGHGLLRFVDAIADKGAEAIVSTSQATLEDAIESGQVLYRQTLTGEMVQEVKYHLPGVSRKSLSHSYDDDDDMKWEIDVSLDNLVNIKGSFEYKTDFIFQLDIRRLTRLQEVSFTFENTAISDLTITSGKSVGIDNRVSLLTIYFTPITIPAGPIVIIVVPVLDISVGVNGKAEAIISSNYSQKIKFETGIKYERGYDWSAIRKTTIENPLDNATLNGEANASLKADITAEIALMVYGVLGAYGDASVYGQLKIDLLSQPWWEIIGGYRLGIGAKATIFGWEIFDKNYPELLSDTWIIAKAAGASTSGTIKGYVKDAETGAGLAAVSISSYQNQQLISSTFSNNDGSIQFNLPAGDNYKIVFSKPGYLDAEYYSLKVKSNEDIYLPAILQIDKNFDGFGSIGGKVINALSGAGVPSATIHLRRGINALLGNIEQTTQSNLDGSYVFNNVPAGHYAITVSKSGYNSNFTFGLTYGGLVVNDKNISLSPVIGNNEYRIILDWGKAPKDLDAHLTGPIQSRTDRFHVFYAEPIFTSNSVLYAGIDHDANDSYGPETITIYHTTPGKYRYSVHDVTNRTSNNSFALSNSSASVKVYKGANLIETFYVPPNTGGTLWTVFEMENEVISPVNSMSYVFYSGDITK